MNLSPFSNQQKLLAVFAHPDDEVFCAGGTLAQAAAMGMETMVVSATRGEAGQIQDNNIATRATLGEVRESELYRSTQQLDVDHTICLDYGDGRLAHSPLEPLIEEITRIIRQFKPDSVITFGPDGAYGHPDHVVISAVTTEAVKVAGNAWAFPQHLAEGLVPHAPEQLYYSYFPRQEQLLMEQLAHWLVKGNGRYPTTTAFAQAVSLFAQEATMLGYVNDHVETSWFPAGFSIIEQDETADKLYLILSGQAHIQQQTDDGSTKLLARIGAGQFFGETGVAQQQPRNAHVVAHSDVTCLVFSSEAPSNFSGRGEGIQQDNLLGKHLSQTAQAVPLGIISHNVIDYVSQKVASLAAHRTQFAFDSAMLPQSILEKLFGEEYFVPVHAATKLDKVEGLFRQTPFAHELEQEMSLANQRY